MRSPPITKGANAASRQTSFLTLPAEIY